MAAILPFTERALAKHLGTQGQKSLKCDYAGKLGAFFESLIPQESEPQG